MDAYIKTSTQRIACERSKTTISVLYAFQTVEYDVNLPIPTLHKNAQIDNEIKFWDVFDIKKIINLFVPTR